MLPWQNWKTITRHAVCTVRNKQVKGEILAKRTHVHVERSKYSESRASFLECLKEDVLDLGQMAETQCLKEDDREKEKAKRKTLGFTYSASVLREGSCAVP